MRDSSDLYAILQVSPDASLREIRAAYHRLARRHHPDVNPPQEDDVQATHYMQQLNAAYEVLSDSRKRAAYDRHRRGENLSWSEQAATSPGSEWPTPQQDVAVGVIATIRRWRRRVIEVDRRLKKRSKQLEMYVVVLLLVLMETLFCALAVAFAGDSPELSLFGIVGAVGLFLVFWVGLKRRGASRGNGGSLNKDGGGA